MTDPYKALGLTRDASESEVKKAYRSLAMKYHPDHNPNNPTASERFNAVASAYQAILKGEVTEPTPSTQSGDSVVTEKIFEVEIKHNFTGVLLKSENGGYTLELKAGFTHNDVYYYTLLNGTGIRCLVMFEDDPLFTVKDRDLYTTMRITKRYARSHKTIEVPGHPHPIKTTINLPKEIQSGQTYTYKDGGLLHRDGSRGNLYIKFLVRESVGNKLGRILTSKLVLFLIIIVLTYLHYGISK